MGCLFPDQGLNPEPSVVRAWSPNHWTAREFPFSLLFVAFFSVEMCVCVFVIGTW